MNNTIVLPVLIIAASYIVLGILFCICVRLFSSSGQKMTLLKEVTTLATLSIEQRYPRELPERKRQLVHKLVHTMLEELGHKVKEYFTIDALVETSMNRIDTEARIASISMHDMPTQMVRAQNTPPLGMRQTAMLRNDGYKNTLLGR